MNLNPPLVSIVIPVYNGSLFISSTLNSVVNQSYKNIETIVVNDGSTDDLESAVRPFFKNHENIRLINKGNSGVSESRNMGMEAASGEYIVFLDADDLLETNFIEAKVSSIGDRSFIGSEVKYFSGDSKNIFKRASSIVKNIPENVLFYTQDLASCPSAYLFNLNFLQDNNIRFHPLLSSIADRDFLLQVYAGSGEGIISEDENSGLLYRIHENNMSGKLTPDLLFDNEAFYLNLANASFLRPQLKREALKKGYEILYKSFWKIRNPQKALKYFFKFLSH